MADPQAEGGREDAVTELWKADLEHVGYTAGAGYRMDESAGDGIAGNISEVAGLVQAMLDRHVGDGFKESSQPPPLWNEEQRLRADPREYSGLARRALLTIIRIVEQDYAGWDLEALEESFTRLCAQLLERGQPQALAPSLDRLRRISGAHAGAFRAVVGTWLADPARVARVVKEADSAARP